MSNNRFTKEELAYIVLNIKGTENKDISKQVGFTEDDNLEEMIDKLSKERILELNKYNNANYFLDLFNNNDGVYNPFLECIRANHDKFFEGLLGDGKKVQLSWKPTCKELLIESVKIYCTPYKQEYYMKDKQGNLQYIGNDFESYLEDLYSMVDFEYTTLIPFSSFITKIKKIRVFDKLKPNRDYILFNDWLVNINTGERLLTYPIKENKIPYIIIDYEYGRQDPYYQEYVQDLFKRIDTDNLIKSLMYGMFNKRVLKKSSAIFNIQKSKTGKTLLLTPFLLMGLFSKASSDMLTGHEKIGLYGQNYTIFFEEMQDSILLANAFNELTDNIPIPVTRKYKEPVKIPKELLPVVVVNGESMPQFKGRTKGTFNRMSFIPTYKEALTEDDYYMLNPEDEKEAIPVGVEILRLLIDYMQKVSQKTIMETIEQSRKTEKEIMALKENKIDITFEYIKQEPFIDGTLYCITENILIEMIKEIQTRGIITVDLFNTDNSIRMFIRKVIIPIIDTTINEESITSKWIIKDGKSKRANLKEKLQLTKKGKALIQDLGYDLSSLEC